MRYIITLLFLFILSPVSAQSTIVVLLSPSAFQIVQRSTENGGTLRIQGSVQNADFYTLSALWRGLNSGVLYSGEKPAFDVLWPDLPVGQSDLLITVNDVSIVVSSVGIGDVYMVAGQSNAVSAGINLQMYTNGYSLRAGMFNVTGWHELQDPVGEEPYDAMEAGGSQWPILATYILAHNVPVAFGVAAVSGTQIATWQPGSKRYGYITSLMDSLPDPKVRAILWQQGESDGIHAITAKEYSAYLTTLATALYDTYHVPFLPARLYQTYTHVNEGIDMTVAGNDFILAGADLTNVKPDNIHYLKDEKLAQEAWAWYTALVCAGFYTDERIVQCINH